MPRWVFIVILMLSSIGVLNIVLFTLAVKYPPLHVQKRAYDKGLHYGDEMKSMSHFNEQGLAVQPTIIHRNESSELRFRITGGDGQPFSHHIVKILLKRPSDPALDRAVALAETEAGVYSSTVQRIQSGRWDVEVYIESNPPALFKTSLWS